MRSSSELTCFGSVLFGSVVEIFEGNKIIHHFLNMKLVAKAAEAHKQKEIIDFAC